MWSINFVLWKDWKNICFEFLKHFAFPSTLQQDFGEYMEEALGIGHLWDVTWIYKEYFNDKTDVSYKRPNVNSFQI